MDTNKIELTGSIERTRFNITKAGPVLEVRLRVEEGIDDRGIVNWFPLVGWGDIATELNKAMAGRSKGTRLWVQGRLHNKGKKSEGRAETRIVIQAFRILPEPEQVGESTATRLRELVRETTGGMT